jgi:hypothetical protein
MGGGLSAGQRAGRSAAAESGAGGPDRAAPGIGKCARVRRDGAAQAGEHSVFDDRRWGPARVRSHDIPAAHAGRHDEARPSLGLFGQKLFAPILVGPASEQQRFHSEAELATVAGRTPGRVVASDRSSVPIGKIAAQSKGTLWYQVYPQREMEPRWRACSRR